MNAVYLQSPPPEPMERDKSRDRLGADKTERKRVGLVCTFLIRHCVPFL